MHLIDQELNLMVRGDFEGGWKLCEQLHEQIPNDFRHLFNRAWFLIRQGKYQEGFRTLEVGRFLSVYGSPRLNTNKPIWNGQDDLTGKTVIVNMEGGYGDQIIYVRFAKEIKKRGARCILCCDISVHSLFLRVGGVDSCITFNELPTTQHDYWIPSFSCSWLFGHDFNTLPNDPYIIPNEHSVDVWKPLLKSDKIKVGIRWSGNPKFEHQQFRVFPSEYLIDLNKHEQFQFYSLQRDNDIRELPNNVVDLQHLLISWEDTAAAIQNLDLVITSCTSVAHLSAAMGKPTWVIVPILPYHIWAYGDTHSPWYKETSRIYRQTNFADWKPCFQQLEKDLINYGASFSG